MSATYPDLVSSFPEKVDDHYIYKDVDITVKPFIDKYCQYYNNNDFASIQELLNLHPELNNYILNAKSLQRSHDGNIAVQRFCEGYYKDYVVHVMKFKGDFDPTAKYTKYNVVKYVVDGGIQTYIAISDNDIPIGTLPTNEDFWYCATMRGEQGASGLGLSVRGIWDSLTPYYVNDCVSWNNSLWYATIEHTNKVPNDLSTYWEKVADLPNPIIVSTTQPEAQNVGDIWCEILDDE